jgi:DNA polymerase kappa
MAADVDARARVARIVAEASAGSAFAAHAASRDAALSARAAAAAAAVARAPPAAAARAEAALASFAVKLEAARALRRVLAVVDMDAFFAAVEQRDNPALAGVPFAVGGLGMVSTASYAARAFGVRSAMPGFIAKKLCPALLFVPVDMPKYSAAAEAARAVLRQYDPRVAYHSLDEATLDLSALCEREGVWLEAGAAEAAAAAAASSAAAAPPADAAAPPAADAPTPAQQARIGAIVARLRREVSAATGGLTCSAGVSSSSLVAKVASNVNKPDGQCLVFGARELAAFMAPRELRCINGIGRVTDALCAALGLRTCADVVAGAGGARAWLGLGEDQARWLLASALGVSSGEVERAAGGGAGAGGGGGGGGESSDGGGGGGVGRVSISSERTFDPCADSAVQAARVRELADIVAAQMADEGIAGATITCKVKLATFETLQRSFTLPAATADAAVIAARAEALLRGLQPARLRLIGVRVSSLVLASEAPRAGDLLAALRRAPARAPGAAAAAATPAASASAERPAAKRARGVDDYFARSAPASAAASSSRPPPPPAVVILDGSDEDDFIGRDVVVIDDEDDGGGGAGGAQPADLSAQLLAAEEGDAARK